MRTHFCWPDTATDKIHCWRLPLRVIHFVLGCNSVCFDFPLFIWMFGFEIPFRQIVCVALFLPRSLRYLLSVFGFCRKNEATSICFVYGILCTFSLFQWQTTIVKKLSHLIRSIFAGTGFHSIGVILMWSEGSVFQSRNECITHHWWRNRK